MAEERLARAQRVHYEGLPVAEAGQRAGVSVATAYRRLAVASPPRVHTRSPGPPPEPGARRALRALVGAPRRSCDTDTQAWTAMEAVPVRQRGEAVDEAVANCRACPVLDPCAEVVRASRPRGVVHHNAPGGGASAHAPTARHTPLVEGHSSLGKGALAAPQSKVPVAAWGEVCRGCPSSLRGAGVPVRATVTRVW